MAYRVSYHLTDLAKARGCDFRPSKNEDSGYCIKASNSEAILPLEQKVVKTGLYLSMPYSLIGTIKDCIRLALLNVRIVPGFIDSADTGEVYIILHNYSDNPLIIEPGDEIAKIIFLVNGQPRVVRGKKINVT